jgi:hypothetical protein
MDGHFHGDSGHDHDIAYLGLADVLVRAGSLDGGGRDKRETVRILAQWGATPRRSLWFLRIASNRVSPSASR